MMSAIGRANAPAKPKMPFVGEYVEGSANGDEELGEAPTNIQIQALEGAEHSSV